MTDDVVNEIGQVSNSQVVVVERLALDHDVLGSIHGRNFMLPPNFFSTEPSVQFFWRLHTQKKITEAMRLHQLVGGSTGPGCSQ